ncbi:MAG: hypothetical protein ABSC64_20690 [Candidatus Korobacteraceae bacterium]
MTIAAGLRSNSGVLMCADTQISGGDVNTAQSKLFAFNAPLAGLNVIVSFAGTVANCRSVIGKIYNSFNSVDPCDGSLDDMKVSERIEEVVRTYHEQHLYKHPHYGYSGGPVVYLLIAVQYRSGGKPYKTSLFSTSETNVTQHGNYAFIGAGESIANYIVEPLAYLPLTAMPTKHVILLADHMLHQVKRFVPGCGGASQFKWMGDDGAFHPSATQMYMPELYSSTFRRIMADLFYAAADLDKDDRLVSLGLELTDKRIKEIREEQRSEVERRAKLGSRICDLPVIATPWPLDNPVNERKT